MKNIYKLLPFFIVEFLAKRFCEKTKVGNKEAFIVFNNTYILNDENK